MKPKLTINRLKKAAKDFCKIESKYQNKSLFGVTDGKAVGTYIEHKFQDYLAQHYTYQKGSSARGIDLPSKTINTDIKVTSARQPQSSSPFRDAKQKIFGLGYNLLVFVYDKTDDTANKTTILNFVSCSFLDKEHTADYTTTFTLRQMLTNGATKADIIAYLVSKNTPADETGLSLIADRILQENPKQGYLTISNALQWRLQYSRVVKLTEPAEGISKLIDKISS